ncbi:MAG: hybrid sensor histidine kinase/response regulator [Massilia sp.]|nr:hybrid sensor histidine kinase/response regulator [Massilia sp.]
MVLDRGGDIMTINRNGVAALGIDDESVVLYQPLGTLWRAARQDAVNAALEQARSGAVGRFTSAAPSKNGRPRWWDVTITRIDGDGGTLQGLLELARDVTGVRQADQQLHRSEARYRSLVAASNVIEWEGPASGQFETVQPAWSAFTGQRFDQYCGYGWLDAVHPDDRARTERTWIAAQRRGVAYVTEHRLRRVDGAYHHMLVRAVPVVDADGTLREWIGVHIDVEERRGVEERLRLLDAMSEATRNADDARSVMAVSTRMLGQHLNVTRCPYADVAADNDYFSIRYDWLAEGAVSTVGDYSLDLFGERAADAMRAGQTLLIRDVDRELGGDNGGDGAAMFNAISCKAIICCPLVKEGKLVAMMAVHQDRPRNWTVDEVALVEEVVDRCWVHIERVRATEALHQADRRKNEFLAILAHELRNPLAPLRNGLQLMQLAGHDAAAMAKVRDMMERQVLQMSHLVDDLLDIARITSGNLDLKPQRLDLADMVAAAVETSTPLIVAHSHTLVVDMPDEPLPLDADPLRVAQVIGNVLNNATKYTPRGGRITVSARRDGAFAAIAIADTGVGIPPEARASVFEMFAQVGDSLSRAQGGLGIGLSLSRRLVELHGGTITLDSSSPAGSTFLIRLPLAAGAPVPVPPAAPAVQAPAAPPAPRAGGPLSVLVVDDNIDAADMLAGIIEVIGHRCVVAHNGAEALRQAPAVRPDLVFLDIGMPGMTGYEVARTLREMQLAPRPLIVAVTGWGDDKDRQRTSEAGFDRHLIKPAGMATVQRLLEEVAGER